MSLHPFPEQTLLPDRAQSLEMGNERGLADSPDLEVMRG